MADRPKDYGADGVHRLFRKGAAEAAIRRGVGESEQAARAVAERGGSVREQNAARKGPRREGGGDGA